MTVLGIPSSITNGSYTAPSGTYTLPASKVALHGSCHVDLSAATLIDGGGVAGLFNVAGDCTDFTLDGLNYTTTSATTTTFISMASGLAGCTVTLNNTTTVGLMKLVTGQQTDPSCVFIGRGLNHTGLAVGIEGIFSIDIDGSTLLGGGPNTSPVGIHYFQDAAQLLLWTPGSYMKVTNSTITGFVSSATTGFRQGDPMLAESSCESVFVDNCITGYSDDTGCVDTKSRYSTIQNCTIHSTGGRAIAAHTNAPGSPGHHSMNNRIYVTNVLTPDGGNTQAFVVAGKLVSTNDVITLVPGSRLVMATYTAAPGSGAAGSYPRVGDATFQNLKDETGQAITGPVVINSNATYLPTVTFQDAAPAPVKVIARNRYGPGLPLPPTGGGGGGGGGAGTIFGQSAAVPAASLRATNPPELDPYEALANDLAVFDYMQTEYGNLCGTPKPFKLRHTFSGATIPKTIGASTASPNASRGLHTLMNSKSTNYASFNAGTFDADVITLVQSCSTTKRTYLPFNHEPEGTVAADWRTSFARWCDLVLSNRGSRPVYPVHCVQAYNWTTAGHNAGLDENNWNCISELNARGVDISQVVFGPDGYSKDPQNIKAQDIFNVVFTSAKSWGFTRFGITETGCVSYTAGDRPYAAAFYASLGTLAATWKLDYVAYYNSDGGGTVGPPGWYPYGDTNKAALGTLAASGIS